ncbi:hypothetical protein TK43_12195 [Roseovarius sp. JS7-11]|nr:hypothetical protein TK43_12195 [Roseovarius sp. JS7-11]
MGYLLFANREIGVEPASETDRMTQCDGLTLPVSPWLRHVDPRGAFRAAGTPLQGRFRGLCPRLRAAPPPR